LLFLFPFHPLIDCGDYKRPFSAGQREKFMGQNVEFVKAIAANSRLTIAFLN